MMNLLDGGELGPRILDLVNVVDLDQVARRRQLDGLDLIMGESVPLPVLLLQVLLLLRGKFPLLVDEEAELADPLLLPVLLCDPVDVHMHPHELGEGLLADQSLSLQVALLGSLGREDLRPYKICYEKFAYSSIILQRPIPNFIRASLRIWHSWKLQPGDSERFERLFESATFKLLEPDI